MNQEEVITSLLHILTNDRTRHFCGKVLCVTLRSYSAGIIGIIVLDLDFGICE